MKINFLFQDVIRVDPNKGGTNFIAKPEDHDGIGMGMGNVAKYQKENSGILLVLDMYNPDVMAAHLLGENELADAIAERDVKIEKLTAALEEISKGEDAYSEDQLEHVTNTINDMKSIAAKAIKDGKINAVGN